MRVAREIQRSIRRSWNLLSTITSISRDRRLFEEELGTATRKFVDHSAMHVYGNVRVSSRRRYWQMILIMRAINLGRRVVETVGYFSTEIERDLRDALAAMPEESRPNGSGGWTMTPPESGSYTQTCELILSALPASQHAIERQAALGGGSAPPSVSEEDLELYQRIVLRAMTLASRESNSYRNTGEAVLGSVGQSVLPSTEIVGLMESVAVSTASGAQQTSLQDVVQDRVGIPSGVGNIMTIATPLLAGVGAYRRATNPEVQLNYWISELCMIKCNRDAQLARRMFERLQRIKQRLDALARWQLDHMDAEVPTIRLPTGSEIRVSANSHTRGSLSSRTGAVRGMSRIPGGRHFRVT